MTARLIAALLLACATNLHAADGKSEGDASRPAGPLTTIAALDVPRYMGTWYEIAKFPNRFQKQCAGDTTADYTLQPDGRVQVVNRCRLDDGKANEAVGAARQVGPATSPKFEVRFAPAWLSFIPAVWGDYWVIDLDPAYRLAAVSEPERQYLWILSRTPQISQQDYESLLNRLRKQGFDVEKLVPTKQSDRGAS